MSQPTYLYRRLGQASWASCDRARFVELSNHRLFETQTLYPSPGTSPEFNETFMGEPAIQNTVPVTRDLIHQLHRAAGLKGSMTFDQVVLAVIDKLTTPNEPAAWEYVGTSMGNQLQYQRLDHYWPSQRSDQEHDYIQGTPLYRSPLLNLTDRQILNALHAHAAYMGKEDVFRESGYAINAMRAAIEAAKE